MQHCYCLGIVPNQEHCLATYVFTLRRCQNIDAKIDLQSSSM